jgi:hypothetical protein
MWPLAGQRTRCRYQALGPPLRTASLARPSLLNDLAVCAISPLLSSSILPRLPLHTYASRRSRSLRLKPKIVLMSERRAVVAVVVSTGRGHDASYSFKTTGATRRAGHHRAARGGQLPVGGTEGRRARRDPANRVRVGLPARQQGPGDHRVPRESDGPVLLPPDADHQDRAGARRPVWERSWARAG